MKQFDIVSFLNRFYGINNISLDRRKLSHRDVPVLFPNIRTCPYKDVKREDLIKGELIAVYDKSNTVMYYYNPHLMIDFDDIPLNVEDDIPFDIKNIDNLSKDELLKIRRKCRLMELQKESKILTKLIRKRKKEEPKLYREKKEKIKIKESYYD